MEFLYPINSENKKIKLVISLYEPILKKELFDPNLINEFCDINFIPKKKDSIASISAYVLSDLNYLVLTFFNVSITKIQKENEKWFNANLFGNEIEKEKQSNENNLSNNKGCMFF